MYTKKENTSDAEESMAIATLLDIFDEYLFILMVRNMGEKFLSDSFDKFFNIMDETLKETEKTKLSDSARESFKKIIKSKYE